MPQIALRDAGATLAFERDDDQVVIEHLLGRFCTLNRPSADDALALRVARLVADRGFFVPVPTQPACPSGFVQYMWGGGGRCFCSRPHPTRAAAICDAAAQVCRSGVLDRSAHRVRGAQ
jgi:hypothetical protein